MGLEFYNTVMGRQLICSDFPRLVEALEKIAENGEKANAAAAAFSNKVMLDLAGVPLIVTKAECEEDGEPYEEISLSLGDSEGNEVRTFAFFQHRPNDPNVITAFLDYGFDSECSRLPINPRKGWK